MRREDLIAKLNRAGLRLDDAGVAAGVAIQMHLRERNSLIVAASPHLSLSKVGGIFGISKVQVWRVLRRHAGKVTAKSARVNATVPKIEPTK